MDTAAPQPRDASVAAEIAAELRDAILSGALATEERLPGEQELAERFGVSRPTIREALKRLAAQNLIRSRRGPTGGTFVNRMSWGESSPMPASNRWRSCPSRALRTCWGVWSPIGRARNSAIFS